MKHQRAYAICLSAGFVLGLLSGAFSILALVSCRVDLYHEQISRLSFELQEKALRLAKLEDTLDKHKLLVKEVQLELVFTGEQLDKMSLEQKIKAKLTNLIGKEVKNVDVELIGGMLDQQIVQADGRLYKVSLTKLLISELLKVWLAVEVAGSDPISDS